MLQFQIAAFCSLQNSWFVRADLRLAHSLANDLLLQRRTKQHQSNANERTIIMYLFIVSLMLKSHIDHFERNLENELVVSFCCIEAVS